MIPLIFLELLVSVTKTRTIAILSALKNALLRVRRFSPRARRKDAVIAGLLQGFATQPWAERCVLEMGVLECGEYN